MPRSLLYLLVRQVMGSWRFRLQRLKQPKYLVGVLGVALYFGFIFVGGGLGSGRRLVTHPESMGLGVTLFLMFQICLIWLFGGRQTGLGFSEAETEILFAAPLTRKELIRYRLMKSLPALLFTSVFLLLLFSISRKFPNPWFTWLSLFVLLNVIHIFQLWTAVVHGFWHDKWWGGWVKIAGLALVLAPVALSISFPSGSSGMMEALSYSAKRAAEGDAGWLSPMIWAGQVVVAPSLGAWLPRCGVFVLLYGLLYQLIVWFDFSFEEREISQSQERASRVRAFREGRTQVVKDRPVRRALLPLSTTGAAWRAVAWKNIIGFTRNIPRSFLFTVLYILIAGSVILFMVLGASKTHPLTGFSVIFAVMAVFLTVMGSSLIKEDLRADLNRLDIVQLFPMPAQELVRGQIYGAAAVIVLAVIASIVLSALCALGANVGFLPPSFVLSVCVLALMLCTCVVMLSFAIENALALLFPAWVVPDKDSVQQPVQMDQMGRSIVLLIARFLCLGLLLLVPGLVLYLMVLGATMWKQGMFVWLGVVLFTTLVWGETELIIRGLGEWLEDLDPSKEGLA
ncbi:MAG: hypothetical protein EP343_00725 [Deltaproteobacteria bacterium]|nr:MAG: hypothetical protein EP343_00725 [Deltaproteobacteria bacterium]